MTTMFVQLRRVVYLLVLLQCCVCAGNASGDAEQHSSTKKSTEDVEQLNNMVAKAFQFVARTNGCLSLYREDMELYKNISSRAEAIESNISTIIKKIEELKGEKKEKEWITKNEKTIIENVRDFDDLILSIANTNLLFGYCKNARRDVGFDMDGFVKARKSFLEAHPDGTHEGPEIEELKKSSSKAEMTLTNLTKRIESLGNELKPLDDVQKHTDDARKAVVELMKAMGDVPEVKIVPKGIDTDELKKMAEDGKEEVTKRLEDAEAKEKRLLEEEGLVERVEGSETEEGPSKETEEGKQDREKEQKPHEEEEEAKGDEEKAPETEKVPEEKGATQEEEEKEGNKEVIAEKEKEGEDKQNKEEAQKPEIGVLPAVAVQGTDSSNSPALVHSPFLLLLLCVLGCTLVC